ncbi:MAG: hydrogenase maturation protease [Xanthomonadales bacterium]|nr:hydrogenase maturation protease [Xanthomonadales bacterium]MDH3925772.1 hydrogenase maturation protease [Xanthomonadales bacterium]MDH3939890.1 hydrogenase maturation protease [Xanthomonadales bacterium]MDH4002237.1 hydrogenase maturation protease [Xanthomonadales bacterium]
MSGVLLFGIGNCGRSDDGLGWAFLDRIQQQAEFPEQVEYRYQLQVEDAAMVSRADRVIFVDSYQGALPGGFQWAPCKPSRDFEFTSHVLAPAAVMYLCQDLYGKIPPAELLLIQGDCWDLDTNMSAAAHQRLENALESFSFHL